MRWSGKATRYRGVDVPSLSPLPSPLYTDSGNTPVRSC